MQLRRRLVVLFAAALLASVLGLNGPGTALADSNLIYLGGPVQHNPTYYAVFWLPDGVHYEPGIINGDSAYEGLMARYLQDAGQTNLANVASQYYDTVDGYNHYIEPSSQFGGSWVDTSAYTHAGSAGDPLTEADIENEVDRALNANPGWTDGVNSTVFVFTGYGIESCSDDGKCTPGAASSLDQSYCAYHFHFDDTRGNTAIFANMGEQYFWDLTAVSHGEGCHTTGALPNGDIYADNEFGALSHEQWEAVTDPKIDAWKDSGGNENGDKCVDQYGYEPYFGPSNVNVGGHLYYVQEEWSNVDGGCAGSVNGSNGFYTAYGPYGRIAGVSTGDINLAQTVNGPSVNIALTPNPHIDWGDGTTVTCNSDPNTHPSCADWGINGCVICTVHASHTYAYDDAASYPKSYTVTVTYNTGCCISYSQSLHIVVFAPFPLTVTPDNQTMTYGGTVPTFTASIKGLEYNDTDSVVTGITCEAKDYSDNPVTSATPPGAYLITCSGATAPGYYAISYLSGELNIIAAPLSITAKDQNTTFGAISFDTSSSSMTFSGFVNNEGPDVLGNGPTITSDVTPTSPPGKYSLNVTGFSDGNYFINTTSGILTVGQASSSTSVSTSGSPSVFGQPVTFTATVSSSAGTPTGSVTFLDGTTYLGTESLVSGEATLTSSSLDVGATHSISASYLGDDTFLTSDSTAINQTVNKASTSTALSSQPNPSVDGDPVTFTATITVDTPGSGTPTGTVAFSDGGNLISGCETQSLANDGTASCDVSLGDPGHHTITAVYGGDGSFLSSQDSLDQNVLVRTSTQISSNINPSLVGQPIVFTAVVSPVPIGGTLTFTDGVTVIAGCDSLPVDANGQATCATTPTTAGPHQITANYSGNDVYSPSSDTLSQSVGQASTTTKLSEKMNLSIGALNATYTATITVNPPGAGEPTGTVAFKVGNTTINGCANQPVDPTTGTATCVVPLANSPRGVVSVSYSGDSNFKPSGATGVASISFQMPGMFRMF